MKKIKIIEVIPNFNSKTGEELGPAEQTEYVVKNLTRPAVFGTCYEKIKIEPSTLQDFILVQGVNCYVSEADERGGINLFNKEPVKIERGEKKKIFFAMFDNPLHFVVECLDE